MSTPPLPYLLSASDSDDDDQTGVDVPSFSPIPRLFSDFLHFLRNVSQESTRQRRRRRHPLLSPPLPIAPSVFPGDPGRPVTLLRLFTPPPPRLKWIWSTKAAKSVDKVAKVESCHFRCCCNCKWESGDVVAVGNRTATRLTPTTLL